MRSHQQHDEPVLRFLCFATIDDARFLSAVELADTAFGAGVWVGARRPGGANGSASVGIDMGADRVLGQGRVYSLDRPDVRMVAGVIGAAGQKRQSGAGFYQIHSSTALLVAQNYR